MSKARRTRARAWRKCHSPLTFIDPNKNKNFPTSWQMGGDGKMHRASGQGGRQKRLDFSRFARFLFGGERGALP